MIAAVADLQAFQQRIVSAMLAAKDLNASEEVCLDLDDEYRETVSQLEDALGSAACCSTVDIVTWDAYVAAYKKQTGLVPKVATREVARAFIKQGDQ